jgi:tetratricopeptide (TPR) repeat protein
VDRSDQRLDGWKSIASYFGRDRSTVSRWARERDLPVHQLPGGKTKTVFAFEHELAAWSRRNQATVEGAAAPPPPDTAPPTDDPPVPASPPAATRRRWLAPAAGIGILMALGGAIWLKPARSASGPLLPARADVARDYVAARDAWGRRTRPELWQAVRLYNRVIDRDPNFAPARAGLAEAWLILREYGDVNEAQAFSAARTAADAALRLDPDLAAAHRAKGFAQYWWDHDAPAATASFRRALELDPNDGQTAFWFANVLADMGRHAEAERYYAAAMIAIPGSQPVAVEHACAQWQAGKAVLALDLLTKLKARYPDDPTVRDCLTWVHMSRGDMRSYAAEFDVLARLRGEPQLIDLAARFARAAAADPATAHRVLIGNARRELATGTRRLRSLPAYYAASMNDRAELIDLLRDAVRLGERWSWPALDRQMTARWRNDREVMRLYRLVAASPATTA